MRVLILAPNIFPVISGNAVTVERWKRALSHEGVAVEIQASQGCSPSAFKARLEQFRPDVIHVHHAFRAGTLLLNAVADAASPACGMVVSPGGTDINVDLDMPERKDAVARVFGMAGAVVAQSVETVDRLRQLLPELQDRILFVRKAFCWFGDEACDLRRAAGCDGGNVLFLLPAGIRPVKRNLECLLALEKVHAARPHLRFVAAGPVIDPEYARRFEREVRRLSAFAVWIDGIPPAAMRSAYEASDVVLNASFSEGLSNSLLEAIAALRPILASDVPGNRSPVVGDAGEEPAGLLYDLADTADFVAKAVRLIDDAGFRADIGRASRLRASRLPAPDQEAKGLIAAYERALAHSGSANSRR